MPKGIDETLWNPQAISILHLSLGTSVGCVELKDAAALLKSSRWEYHGVSSKWRFLHRLPILKLLGSLVPPLHDVNERFFFVDRA